MSANAAPLCRSSRATDSWTQRGQILKHLQAGRPLTPLTALYQFGCNRLAARIWELKEEGYAIECKIVVTATKKRVAEYRISQP